METILEAVVDALVGIFRARGERKPEKELTQGHWIMVALAIAFGLLVIVLLSLFGLTRLG